MRILLVKTSSLGDVIHNLPVLTDIQQQLPNATVDWCVEESFSAIPRLHPGVARIIPVAVRRWRKNLFGGATWREIVAFRTCLREISYDFVLDTQGLLKSALIARQADGPVSGYNSDSARESVSSFLYQRQFSISTQEHAVVRNRQLAAAALGYVLPGPPDYGIHSPVADFGWLPDQPYVTCLTATSRDDKLWPEAHWQLLGQTLKSLGYAVVLPGGSPLERERAARLASLIPGAVAAPQLDIPQLAAVLAGSAAVVGVDTGLTHLAVALKLPTVALYTATDPGLTGVLGAGFFRNLGGKAQLPSVHAVLDELALVLG